MSAGAARDAVVRAVVTVGYVGYLRPGPGTIASAIVALAAFFLPEPRWIEAACAVSALTGLALASPAVRVLGSKDPGPFVLDEFAGMALALAFLPLGAVTIGTAFLLFRFFDIVKPLGVGRLDAMKHPAGIMLDDLLAGLYANLLVRLALVFWVKLQ